MSKTTLLFEPDGFYHIYNHANGNENIFINDDNYQFFLNKFNLYISPVARTYAYCLMPNHFHFLIQLKERNAIIDLFKLNTLDVELDMSKKVSHQFSKFFNSYTQAFNKYHGRRGSLFMQNYKRKGVDSEQYLKRLIIYIHQNPVENGFVDNLNDWKYSSFKAITSNIETIAEKDKVLELFGGIENFIFCHKKLVTL